jgi:hypothetical protein
MRIKKIAAIILAVEMFCSCGVNLEVMLIR